MYPIRFLKNWEENQNKKLKEVSSFRKSINNFNLISRFYEEEFRKFKEKYNKLINNNEVLNTIDSPIIIGSTRTPITLSLTGFGYVSVPLIASVGCGVSIGAELECEFLKKKKRNII